MHDVINGDAYTEVETEDGNIPSIRKSLVDNYYFKSPTNWSTGSTETVHNQLRTYTDGTWWFAPQATPSNPVTMTSNPYTDSNWKVWSKGQAGIYQNAKRLADEAGFTLKGSFYTGATLTTSTDVIFNEADGKYYSWNSTLPKVVSAGSTNSELYWVDKSGISLRSELSRVIKNFVGTGNYGLTDIPSVMDYGPFVS